jgi:molybdenum cofactor cytidylyltransferase
VLAGAGQPLWRGKLAADLGGQPVIAHVARALSGLALARRVVVAGPDVPPLPGFETIPLDPPGAPLSRSLAQGVAALEMWTPLVALADMPMVPPAHFAALVAAFDGNRIASQCAGQVLPPAIFGAGHCRAQGPVGDRGAGALLRGAPALALDPAHALDIDRPRPRPRASPARRARLIFIQAGG